MPKILYVLMALVLSACQAPVAPQDKPQAKASAAASPPADGFIYNVPWGKS